MIPNGWPDEWATQTIAPTPLHGRYVFAMGRLIPLKGFHTLIDAMTALRARHPEVGFVIAGNGSALPELVAKSKSLGWLTAVGPTLPSSINGAAWFPGFVHGDSKRSLIAGAQLAVSPSIRQEPMSLALFEMLSCGVPVVGSNVGGTPDIVIPGVNGELFAAENSVELAAKLDRLLSDSGRRARLAAAAKESVDAYRWSEVAARFIEVFGEVTATRSAKAA